MYSNLFNSFAESKFNNKITLVVIQTYDGADDEYYREVKTLDSVEQVESYIKTKGYDPYNFVLKENIYTIKVHSGRMD